jgi:hypothetical protein
VLKIEFEGILRSIFMLYVLSFERHGCRCNELALECFDRNHD